LFVGYLLAYFPSLNANLREQVTTVNVCVAVAFAILLTPNPPRLAAISPGVVDFILFLALQVDFVECVHQLFPFWK
jgi:hypothetical protein